MIDQFWGLGNGLVNAGWWTTLAWPVIWTLIKIVAVVAPLMGAVAYLTLWERKAIGFTQIRIGPNRIGPLGLLQPIADALKLLTKEIIIPTVANKGLFLLGPIMPTREQRRNLVDRLPEIVDLLSREIITKRPVPCVDPADEHHVERGLEDG